MNPSSVCLCALFLHRESEMLYWCCVWVRQCLNGIDRRFTSEDKDKTVRLRGGGRDGSEKWNKSDRQKYRLWECVWRWVGGCEYSRDRVETQTQAHTLTAARHTFWPTSALCLPDVLSGPETVAVCDAVLQSYLTFTVASKKSLLLIVVRLLWACSEWDSCHLWVYAIFFFSSDEEQ